MSEIHAPIKSVLTGAIRDVRTQLTLTPENDKVLALTFDAEQADDVAFATLAENLSTVATAMLTLLSQRQEPAALQQLAEALTPRAPASPHLLKEAAMLAQARRAVLDSADWLSAAQLAQLAGLSARNPSAQPNKWKKEGRLFAIQLAGVDYFPGYGLDAQHNFRPLRCLAEVIAVLSARKDGWGMAYWFASVNGFLDGQRPQDVLAHDPARVLAAAKDEIEEIDYAW